MAADTGEVVGWGGCPSRPAGPPNSPRHRFARACNDSIPCTLVPRIQLSRIDYSLLLLYCPDEDQCNLVKMLATLFPSFFAESWFMKNFPCYHDHQLRMSLWNYQQVTCLLDGRVAASCMTCLLIAIHRVPATLKLIKATDTFWDGSRLIKAF